MPIEAAPIVVDPSGEFLGIDGDWSTFLISAGTPPQQLQVLASTEVSSTWIIAPNGCSKGASANCTEARGGLYDGTKSSSWNTNGLYGLGDESILGYQGNEYVGTFGYDTLEIQGKDANVSVDHQVIAAIQTNKFFVGNLGLSPNSINFTSNPDTESSPSLLTSLKSQNLIPSLSYGYTAGASYQQKNGALGSLTLGGYDTSRFISNDVSFDFAGTEKRQLQVCLKSVTYSTSGDEAPLLSEAALALVDSTVPYLWLPQSACQAFEKAFGISHDPISNLYLVNETQHDTLLKKNASTVFELVNNLDGGPSINITLPYASFDLVAKYPLAKNPSRYFPLQRANDDDAITLGRTFLQEAYLIVDYEHSNFSVSQTVFDPNAQSHIVPLISTPTSTTGGTAPNPTSSNGPIVKTTSSSGSHGIGTGAIAGIAIAIVLLAALCGAFFIFKCLGRRKNKKLNKDIEVERSEVKVISESDEDFKRDFSEGLEVKKSVAATVTVSEAIGPMTPPTEMDGYFTTANEKEQTQSRTFELPSSPPNRSELSTPEPWGSELPSPDPDVIRSELSTPDPVYDRSELPSPNLSHKMPSSPGLSSLSSGQSSLDDSRCSALCSPAQLPFQRPLSDRMDSSDSEAGWTRDGMPHRSFRRRYQSDESLPSRPLSSRMDSSDSEGLGIRHHRVDESEESEPIVSPITARRNLTHLDSSSSVSDPAITPSPPTRPRPTALRIDSTSSDSDTSAPAPSPQPNPNRRRIVGLTTPFYSSTNSRPAIRRSIHDVTSSRPYTIRTDSSDSEAWQTSRLESASTETPSDMSRLPSVRHSYHVANNRNDPVFEEEERR